MTTQPMTLTALIADCIREARTQGYDGTDAAYELTAPDCEWIVSQLGRKPTREEWTDAGMRYVGSAHVAGESAS